MTLQEPASQESGKGSSAQPTPVSPIPYFSDLSGRMPLVLRLACILEIAHGGWLILGLSILMVNAPNQFFDFTSSARFGWSIGVSSCGQLGFAVISIAAASITLSGNRYARQVLRFWVWGSLLWCAYNSITETTDQIFRMAALSWIEKYGGVHNLKQWFDEAAIPIFTLGLLRMSEIRAYFDANEGA